MSYITNEMEEAMEMSGHRYLSTSGFPEADLEEPPDDDVVYHEFWAEAEVACLRKKEFAERWNAEQAKRKAERLKVEEPELVGSK